MNLDALRSLQKQAGHAGDWTLEDYVTHIDIRSELEGIAVEVPGIEEQDWAIAKLVAVSKNHLLPIAEALERAIHPGDNPTAWDDAKGVLEALQEALDAS